MPHRRSPLVIRGRPAGRHVGRPAGNSGAAARPAARAVLRGLLLSILVVFLAAGSAGTPWSPLPQARADSGDGDGDGGAAAAGDAGGSPGGPGAGRPAAPEVVPFEVIALDLSSAQLAELQRLGYTLLDRDRLQRLGGTLFRLREPPLLRRFGLADALRRAGLDDRLHPNHRYRIASGGCADARCYPFQAIGWPVQGSRCGLGVTIGMIDTAVDRSHAALQGARLETRSFLGGNASPAHGTAVAALLVGQPGSAHPGLLAGARLLAADVFERDLLGQPRTDAHAIVRALEWLATRNARVVNMSFAGPDNAVLHEVIRRATRRNVAVVAAAGNEGPFADPVYPAGWDDTIAVTAVDAALGPYRRANRGDYVEFAAPGVGIWTARAGGEGRFDDGTSLAAVYVSAALANLDPSGRLSVPVARQRLARQALDLGDRGVRARAAPVEPALPGAALSVRRGRSSRATGIDRQVRSLSRRRSHPAA